MEIMINERTGALAISDARIRYKNFSGKEGRYNREGDKSFSVVIEDGELAQQLLEDGWNVKIKINEDEEPSYHIPVAVSYKFDRFAPKVFLVKEKGTIPLDENSIGELDYANIIHIDLTIRPRVWTDDEDNKRIKAYLKNMYVTIEEEEFADKYGM